MADKDYDGMIEALKPITASAYTVTPDNPRSLPAADYAAHFLSHKVPAKAFTSVPEALREAMRESREQNRPLICLGSLYLYADLAAAYRALTGSL